MNRSVWWGGGIGLLVLLFAGMWWASSQRAEVAAVSSSSTQVIGQGSMGPAPQSTLPSASAPAMPGQLPALAARAASGATDSNRPKLQDIQAELQALSAGGRTPQPKELDAVFEKLERYNGSSQMGGVDLQLIRKNLQAAARIQNLSEQMKPLAADPTPENVQKLQALVAEMREVQATMDVKGLMAAAAALPGGKP